MLAAIGFASAVAVAAELYCPTQDDFDFGGQIAWENNGWTMTGEGGIHAKTSWNLLGGYVEFDFDISSSHAGVNTNLYLTSPTGTPGGDNYCDIQDNGHGGICMEMDIIEANGNCAAQATWHTWANHDGDCDQGGCYGNAYISGSFKVRASFTEDGWMGVSYDGGDLSFTPHPSTNAQQYVADTMRTDGATIEASQWVGWVPHEGSCPSGGDVHTSRYSVRNLRVSGTVLKGKQPTLCGGGPTPTPPPSPSPAPPSGDYIAYGGQTAYRGHGGDVEIDSDDTAPSGLSVAQCEARCTENSACECVSFRPSDGKCWARGHPCVPSLFGADSSFDTYVKRSQPSPTPSPSPPSPSGGLCCFGASGCGADADCHPDAYCGASQEKCEGDCGAHWCAQKAVGTAWNSTASIVVV